jgi:uncharacterized membrane protein
MAKRKTTDTVSFTLRMREELRAVLEGAAKEKEISLNQEIVDRLKMALTARVIEANQKLVLAQLALLSTKIDEVINRMERAETKLENVHELSEGGYEELTNEIKVLRSAIERGTLDPEDRN